MKKFVWKGFGQTAKFELGTPWTFETRPGGWIIAQRTSQSGAVERRKFSVSDAQGSLSASIDGKLWYGKLASEGATGISATAGSDADLVAQFPGKVRKVLVKSGQKVEEGEPLLLVEAMKMEFSIKAPFAGTLSNVLVQEGQTISPGTRFVDLAAEAKKTHGH